MDIDQMVDTACAAGRLGRPRRGHLAGGTRGAGPVADDRGRAQRARASSAMTDQIVGYLVNRLQIEQWYARHPEIDDQEIVAPLFGLGLPRTGSTALSFLLAQDPARRSLRTWEAGSPCPPPETATEHTDPRIADGAGRHRLHQRDVPRLRRDAADLGDRAPGVPAAHGLRLPVADLRGHGARPELHLVAAAVRHGAGLPLPPAGAEAAAVALPARAVVAQDPGPHALDRRARRGVSRRPVRHDPPRRGQGAAVGVRALRHAVAASSPSDPIPWPSAPTTSSSGAPRSSG